MRKEKKRNDMKILSKQDKYQELDFLKGVSILTIVLMHLIQVYMKNLPAFVYKGSSLGGTGVHIFFLCSGFGLYLSQTRKKLSTKEFYQHRLSKIYFPYIIIVVISFFIPFMYNGSDRIQALLSHVFLYKMFIPRYEISFGLQLWYISTIIQFYIVFPLLYDIRRKQKHGGSFLAMMLILSVCWWIFVACIGKCDERVWNSFFLQYLWEFALGMEVAAYLNSGKDIVIKKWALLICSVLGVGLQMVMALCGGNLKLFNDIPALIGYGSLVLLLYSMGSDICNRMIQWISRISYEWYLVHILVLSCCYKVIRLFQGKVIYEILAAILAFGISLVVAAVYARVIHGIAQGRKVKSGNELTTEKRG